MALRTFLIKATQAKAWRRKVTGLRGIGSRTAGLPEASNMESQQGYCEVKIHSSRVSTFPRTILKLIAPLLLAFGAASVEADQWSLLLNGKAIHLEKPLGTHYNEENWGAGVQYDFSKPDSRWIPFLTASGFKDSNKHPSYYAGGGMMRRYAFGSDQNSWHVDAGLVAFAMIRRGYQHGNPFLGALPVISFGTDRVSLNVTYIPKVDPKMIPLLFLQMKVGIF